MTARHLIPRNCRSARGYAPARLARWCDRFQASLDREIDLEAFATEGRAIARAVKAELPDWSIVYFDEAAAAREKYQGPPSAYEVEIE
jgi:hypothetical protein